MAYINLNGVALATESGGAVALGTGVTMANATFPAGHVLQVQSLNSATRVSTTHTAWTEPSTAYRVAITPQYASSKINIHYYIPFNYNCGSNVIALIRAFRMIGGGAKSYALSSATSTQGGVRHIISGGSLRPVGYDAQDSQMQNWLAVDLPNTTSECVYGFETYPQSTNTSTFGYSAGDSNVWGWETDIVITATEIKV